MSNSRELSFAGGEVTEERLCALESNADLETLIIWGGEIGNGRLAPLSRLTRLKGLVLGEMAIDDGVFQHFKTLRELSYLNLAYTNIEGDFTALAGLPLRDVRLEGCRRAGDRCAETLAAFPGLRQLEIHMTGLTDEGVRHLAHLPLEVLWLGGRITDHGMDAVAAMTGLKHLDVCAPGVTDRGVGAISGLTGLEVLWLSQCRITDASVSLLSQFKSLRELAVGRTGITAEGRARLRELLPQCRLVAEGAGV
ncbi:MAG TPA: hypothetical protein VE959_13010 [Bryobacteraceae bacterium]|nr:hypothetical protein [Bryobacteraceae bacterium]